MSRTRRIPLPSGQWGVVCANASFCVLQMQGDGPIHIAVAESLPSEGDPGVMLVKNGLTEISFFDLAGTDVVYAFTEDSNETLVAIDNGS